MAMASAGDWKKAKVAELREELAKRGLDTTGLKAALLERLEEADRQAAAAKSEEPAGGQSADGTGKQGSGQVQSKEVASGEGIEKADGAPQKAQAKPREESKAEATEVDGKANGKTSGAGPTALEKKQQRAERFGVKLEMTESEKARLRAERFGLPVVATDDAKKTARAERFGTTIQGSVDSDQETKRAARAERFGMKGQSASIGEEEEKKKKRAERFGTVDNKGDEKKRKVDSAEEERRKKRGERFAPLLKSQSV